jgi:hypothetical protein
MTSSSANLDELLGKTKLVVLPEDYYVISLPVDAKPIPGEWYRPATTRFAVFIREPNEITLVVPRRKWLRMQHMFDRYDVSDPMKVITFDIKLSFNVYGYIAAISRVLADAGISVLPMSSFKRDHILVQKKDLPRSVKLLRQYLLSFKKKKSPARKSKQ